MTTTSSVDPYAFLNGAKSSPTATGKNDELGQNAFLKLMLAQLKNQDPMKPQDPTQFLSQLAQFSQVTSIQNMEGSIEALSESLRANQLLNGTSLVGRDVLASASENTIEAGGTVSGVLDLPKGTSAVKVVVKDASGAQVRTFDLDRPVTGLNDFTWNGLTNTGTPVPAGTYTFEAVAAVSGENVSLDPMLMTRVSSVTIDAASGSLSLNTSAGAVALSSVRRVL